MKINPDLVYKLIARIPLGKVSTYKLLAQEFSSKGYRAIGNIVGNNKNIPAIPCHRIVKSNGTVGDYIFGEARKIELLKEEGVYVDNNKIIDFEKKLFKF